VGAQKQLQQLLLARFLLMWFADHRICRRGTEKPCYKITSFQDIGLRASFEAARQKCREGDGELLSIETENEQRLVERFVQELRASDGDFWIGLRRSSQYNSDCSSQYYWLDYIISSFSCHSCEFFSSQ
uniref:Layilin b n=1 Tax=Cyprinus carpio TaxID=7962 RepID=A0A8C1TSA5_CYPCA